MRCENRQGAARLGLSSAYATVQRLAEEVGFEPTERLPARWFSRPVP